MNAEELLLLLGSQTTKCNRTQLLEKSNPFSKSDFIDPMSSSQKLINNLSDSQEFRIKKRNKFKTFPRSCLKEK